MNDFNLPNIPEDLDKEEFDYRNKYRNIYIRLIIRCQNMTEQELSGYNERHHILPKCLGGGNESENLVLMPVRYHIMAHILLFKAFPNNSRLALAVNKMINSKKDERGKSIEKNFSTRTIATLREDFIKSVTGENNPLYGKSRPEEVKQKLSVAALNRSQEAKDRILEGRKKAGYRLSKDAIERMAAKLRGRKTPESVKEKIRSSAKRGKDNPNATKVISPEGKVFGSIKEASVSSGIPYSTLTKWLDNKESPKNGWKYESKKSSYPNRDISKSSKPVIGPDNKIYPTVIKACEDNNIPYTTMRYWISGRVKNNHGWKYYTEDNNSQSD